MAEQGVEGRQRRDLERQVLGLQPEQLELLVRLALQVPLAQLVPLALAAVKMLVIQVESLAEVSALA